MSKTFLGRKQELYYFPEFENWKELNPEEIWDSVFNKLVYAAYNVNHTYNITITVF